MTMIHFPWLERKTAPATEPITLTEAKLYLRVDHADEDSLITNLISSAREEAEHYMRNSLITQTWTSSYDEYAPVEVPLFHGPVQSITSVKSIDRDSVETVISSNTYRLSAGKDKLLFDEIVYGNVVEVEYVTGFGAASDVPDAIKQGILAHVADLYEQRPNYTKMAQTSRRLFDAYRKVRV